MLSVRGNGWITISILYLNLKGGNCIYLPFINKIKTRGGYGENQMVPDDENPYYAKLAKAPTYKLR